MRRRNAELEKSETAQKRTEEALQQSEVQFRHAQKMEAVGRLAGGVAHDFNNILSIILSYSGFLREELDPEDPLRKDAMEIEQAGRRAADLTRQLLAFSRRQIMKPQLINLNEVVLSVEKMLRRILGEDIDLAVDLDENLSNVMADRGQFEQVLMNLAVNARDAMPDGGKLAVKTSNVGLDENYGDIHKVGEEVIAGPYIMITVSDTGTGMTEETREHLFEPFFTTKEIDKGTGLGLSTVYGIVQQNNGFIWVYSEPGEGSTFKIYLPKTKEDVKEVDEKRRVMHKLTGDETVLVVEDDKSMRLAAVRILT